MYKHCTNSAGSRGRLARLASPQRGYYTTVKITDRFRIYKADRVVILKCVIADAVGEGSEKEMYGSSL